MGEGRRSVRGVARSFSVVVAALALAATTAVSLAAPASAATTITVTTTADTLDPNDGQVSLREATLLADVATHTDTIALAPSSTYALTYCDPVEGRAVNGTLLFRLASAVTIEGNGSTVEQTCPQGTGGVHSDAFSSAGTALTLSHVTVSGADSGFFAAPGPAPAGPLLTLDHSTIKDATGTCVDLGTNSAGRSVAMRSSRLDGCGGNGINGGAAAGLMDLQDSEITRVTKVGTAEGLALSGKDALILRSSIHHNQAGALMQGSVTMTDSHFDHNTGAKASFVMTNIVMTNPGMTITDSTFDDNVMFGVLTPFSFAGLNIGGWATLTRVSASRNHGPRAGMGFIGGSTLGNDPRVEVYDSHVDGNVTDVPTTVRRVAGINWSAPQGALTVTRTTANGNIGADTAGLWSDQTAYIIDSTFAGNTVPDTGTTLGKNLGWPSTIGAGFRVDIVGSTITGNTVRSSAGPSAGGVVAQLVFLTNTTVVGNSGDVGGVYANGNGQLYHDTFTDNVGTKARHLAVDSSSYDLFLGATVLSSPAGAAGPSCVVGGAMVIRTLGYNFVSDGSCPLTAQPVKPAPDIVDGGDPRLEPLRDAGGPTAVRVPLAGSPLRDAVPAVLDSYWLCNAPDQLGVSRPQGTGCDTGAVEAKGSRFHALPPARLLDSRTPANPGFSGPLVAGSPRTLTVTGGQVPPGAGAVVLNVTATGSSSGSYLTVWPGGAPQPNASVLNFAAGQTIPNMVTVEVGAGGAVELATNTGSTDVVVDLLGYFDDGTTPGDGWRGIDPVRALDSRTSTGGWSGALAVGAPRDLVVRPVGGTGGVPANATAVVANVTATGSSANSFLTVWPSGLPQPTASSVNFAAGETIANAVIVPVGEGGAIRLATAVGTTDVVVDVIGYLLPDAGARFFPLSPTRVLDDRVAVGATGPWGPGQIRGVAMTGGAISTKAVGVAANITVTNGTAPSFVTVFPHRAVQPDASTLNFAPGQTIANATMVRLVTGQVDIFNQQGGVDVIADVVGFYDEPLGVQP